MKITVRTIPHNLQRYPTVGDWWFKEPRVLEIRVSETNNWRYNVLVAVHEIVEAVLCRTKGITDEDVTAFDKEWEKKPDLRNDTVEEPGDSNRAPYRRQHCIATGIERILAAELDINWAFYEDALERIYAQRRSGK